ncbi:MAG: hypothetical protein LBP88_07255 [Treponema sp.]|jgi:hypothetical protein|nr:hypothetical protein [Treponema sp.]
MIELNELDKEYIALCTKGMDEQNRKEETAFCLEKIELMGNIQNKSTNDMGFPQFTFKDGFTTTIAPRRYRFTGPLMPTEKV